MYSEDDLLPISALQHLSFCERQWGLIHLEQIWSENVLTVEGDFLHKRSDEYGTEVRSNVRIARGLRLRSLQLGLSGIADVVEFHQLQKGARQSPDVTSVPKGIRLRCISGLWAPFPVEFKRGRPKKGRCDEVQLCAQALCLEEMLAVFVPAGALFYGKTRRRHDVAFDQKLRGDTKSLAERLHMLTDKEITPSAVYGKHCESCSLKSTCQPKAVGERTKITRYIAAMFDTTEGGDSI